MKVHDETNERESVLLSSAAKGDLEAFNKLILKYQDLVYNITRGILGNPDAAQDATQEAFFRAFRHIGGFRAGSFRCWLLRIAVNICYDALRTLRRHPTVPLIAEDRAGNETDCPVWMADPCPSPEAEIEKDELLQMLSHRIEELPAAYRTVITLVDLNGFDYDEAAQALRVPIGTVKSRLARARLRIKESLSQDSPFGSAARLSRASTAV